ncbi:hypothetical protein F4859DRAFT_289205 [Xylaria cf. heliscus]|nr:hypothetical protein F4859DRAFT_289205 [Xylaria cf. heliscus]
MTPDRQNWPLRQRYHLNNAFRTSAYFRTDMHHDLSVLVFLIVGTLSLDIPTAGTIIFELEIGMSTNLTHPKSPSDYWLPTLTTTIITTPVLHHVGGISSYASSRLSQRPICQVGSSLHLISPLSPPTHSSVTHYPDLRHPRLRSPGRYLPSGMP